MNIPRVPYSIRNTQNGQALLVVVVFLLFISLAVGFGLLTPVITDARIASNALASSQSLYTAEAGVEDVVYRLQAGMEVDETEELALAGATTTITTTDTGSNEKQVRSEGNARSHVRVSQVGLTVSSGASFNYGLQAGDGGFDIQNTASVNGNAYSNGPIAGQNSNIIRGDVVSASSTGLIDGIHATGTAYANTIRDSEIDNDAYYKTIEDTTVGGTEYSDSEDKPKIDLPITDSMIEDWKDDAESGGVINCSGSYQIEEDTTLGPVKIGCDLEIGGDPTITLDGNVWVEGDITVQNTVTMNVSQAQEGESVVIMADYPSDPESKGRITLQNSAEFNGVGEGSYIMFISQNNSAERGGGTNAIEVQNEVNGDLLVYAAHGRISLKNSVDLREVVAYVIEMQNSTEVTYETGLASLLFTSGPGGTWSVNEWREVE